MLAIRSEPGGGLLRQDVEALAEYESQSVSLFARKPLYALCQYNQTLFKPEILKRAAL